MSGDNGLGLVVIGVLVLGYLLPSIIVTFRGCRRAWLCWILNISLGWSGMMWAYLLFRAVVVDHENDDQYSHFSYTFRD
jgi:Superinfection immunity protein